MKSSIKIFFLVFPQILACFVNSLLAYLRYKNYDAPSGIYGVIFLLTVIFLSVLFFFKKLSFFEFSFLVFFTGFLEVVSLYILVKLSK